MTHIDTTFSVKAWDEKTWEGDPANDVQGSKMTHAAIKYGYKGDLSGESDVQYIMCYRDDKTGVYYGLEKITGSLNGKQGSFVIQHDGIFDETTVNATVTIVPDCGTDGLEGLTGTGQLAIDGHAEQYTLSLDYELA